MNGSKDKAEKQDWQCHRCKIPMNPGKVKITYMGNDFTIELLKCTQCGLVFVPEDMAIRKMLEVEQSLEDK
ncbi:MAG: hypothetical protein BWY80_00116 [Firmicutes bacterium ADurb.Bin456]|nr:MAG: hypothetical protein BWY80_00116 [Firmicutes bacterium ADurb.Bin456]